MNKLVFATNNKHKTNEVRKLLANQYYVFDLEDIGCLVDIPETGGTFAENASLKSAYIVENFDLDCFADDSGLEIEALSNEPGVFSARYSGERDDAKNMQLVLDKLENIENRKARFKTVISLMHNGKNYLFEGVIEGTIRTAPGGTNGFGYDPIFEPKGYNLTFAEMDTAEKNRISHRAQAMRKLIDFLQKQR